MANWSDDEIKNFVIYMIQVLKISEDKKTKYIQNINTNEAPVRGNTSTQISTLIFIAQIADINIYNKLYSNIDDWTSVN